VHAEDFPSVLYLYEGSLGAGPEIVRVPARAGRAVEEADLLAAHRRAHRDRSRPRT
jgi:hypothetical protein